jgi:hypothetical protein
MLLRTFFLIFILSLLTLTMLATTLYLGKAVLYERALAYVPAAYQTALARIAQSFAAGNGAYAPAPSTSPTCISNDTPCTFYANETIALPAQTAPTAARTCDATLSNCAQNMQEQVIAESRIGIEVTASIYDAGKSLVVKRTKFLTLRTFGVAPYFAVIGERDGAMGDRGTAPEGENAGLTGSATQADTQIKVRYHDTTGANPDSEHDRWSTQGWSSGNASASNWSQ